MPPLDLTRVVVVGTSCAGKTTLARRLAGILGSEYVELDSVYWGPGWTPRPDFIKTVLTIAQRPRWVIDGNYSAVRDIWRRSSAIVWLDYSFARVFSQALRRTARRIITRERLYAGNNRETIRNALFDTDGIPWWVIRTHGKRRREFPELFKRPEYGHAAVIQLDRPAAAEAFLATVSARSGTTNPGHTRAD